MNITDAESKVVNAIRANGNAVISLVAVAEGKVVGHILFSPVATHPPTPEKGLGLAPVAVLPEFHSQGIGSQLIRAGLEQCRELGYDYAVVLGGPKYYMRFGFEKASDFGLQNEYGSVNQGFVSERGL
jgi:putative acetyltransferase